MDLHSMVSWLLGQVSLQPPEESESITVIGHYESEGTYTGYQQTMQLALHKISLAPQ